MREAIVLAGGLGTRLREVVPDWPKPMAPVAGRPFLEILLRSLATKGFSSVVLSVGFMAEKIINHFGSQYAGVKLKYVVEDHPLGTGGAIRLAMPHCLNDHIFVLNGDTFLDIEEDLIEKQWHDRKNPIIVAKMSIDTARYGKILVEDGLVIGFDEKGKSGPGLINAGCYIFNRGLLDEFDLYKKFSLENDFLTSIVKTKSVDVYITNGEFIDIGVPEDYLRAQTELADR